VLTRRHYLGADRPIGGDRKRQAHRPREGNTPHETGTRALGADSPDNQHHQVENPAGHGIGKKRKRSIQTQPTTNRCQIRDAGLPDGDRERRDWRTGATASSRGPPVKTRCARARGRGSRPPGEREECAGRGLVRAEKQRGSPPVQPAVLGGGWRSLPHRKFGLRSGPGWSERCGYWGPGRR